MEEPPDRTIVKVGLIIGSGKGCADDFVIVPMKNVLVGIGGM